MAELAPRISTEVRPYDADEERLLSLSITSFA